MGDLVEVLQLLLILGSITSIGGKDDGTFFLPSYCTKKCGNISIDYPFGIENGCFHAADFNLACKDKHSSTPRLWLGGKDTIEVLQIDITKGVIYIKSPIVTMDIDKENISTTTLIDLENWPYSLSLLYSNEDFSLDEMTDNYIYVRGCSAIADIMDSTDTTLGSCLTRCSSNSPNGDYDEISNGHCMKSLPFGTNVPSLRIQLMRLNQKELHLTNTSRIDVFMFDFEFYQNITELTTKKNRKNFHVGLAWYINDGYPTCEKAKKNISAYACRSRNSDCHNAFYDISSSHNLSSIGYICLCSSGYQGNPYVTDGCREVSPPRLSPDKDCETLCGNITVPFPFGLTMNCSRDESFVLKCSNGTSGRPTLLFDHIEDIGQYTYTVINVPLEEGQLELKTVNASSRKHLEYDYRTKPSQFLEEHTTYSWVIAADPRLCNEVKKNKTTYACVADNSVCLDHITSDDGSDFPGYRCKCANGYRGNPYVTNGCQDIDECNERNTCHGTCENVEGSYNCIPTKSTLLLDMIAGISSGVGFLLLCAFFFILRKKFRKRHQDMMKKRCFHQNHGLLLKQLISSGENTTERTKIFSLEEIEKATNNFDKTRVLGHGGHGTVYKGILSDQRVVAIKKSKIVKKSEIDQFINEVAILSQVNHRHIVKIYGCCLETEVPLLIYEFISNGALSDHLHGNNGNSALSWEDRLRIVAEAAGALAYLHSATSISILHRDVKSSNILLDDHFVAKVSDFGASRFIPDDQTHIITAVQGTFGYLDPEYYQTTQLTQKSDVYSFGVILLEILTGKKPLYTTKDEQDLNLSMHFLQATRANRSFDLVEDRVMKESNKEELNEIFQLVQMCLKLKGVDRPTMKEVEYKLQRLRQTRTEQKGYCILEGNEEEAEYLLSTSSYGSSDGTLSSRNYSLEKEVLWSQHYAR